MVLFLEGRMGNILSPPKPEISHISEFHEIFESRLGTRKVNCVESFLYQISSYILAPLKFHNIMTRTAVLEVYSSEFSVRGTIKVNRISISIGSFQVILDSIGP